MPGAEEGSMSRRRRPSVALFIGPVVIGLLGLSRVMQSPRFESYRTVDVIQLVASGACLGAALTGFIVRLLRART